jgi:energy-coupling factor transporter ATP-binding protein EcfA2
MDKSRLLELENKFILLKRYDRSLDEIAKLLPTVSQILLKKWDSDYSDAINHVIQRGLENIATIAGKDTNGEYLLHSSIVLDNIRKLDDVKYELVAATMKDQKLESTKQTHLNTFNQYFKSINFEYNGTQFDFDYILTTGDAVIKQQAEAAVNFYAKYFLSNQTWLIKKKLINKASVICFKNFNNVLPYAIKQFKVENFQDIKNISIENLNIDAKWILLTGENSFGKTTVLQAIACSLTSEKKVGFQKENFAIELELPNSNLILNYWDKFNFKLFPHLACYGASRLMLQTERSQNIEGSKSTTTYSLFNNDGLLLNIEYDLFKWFYKKDARFETVINIFKKLIPNIQDIVLDEKDDTIYYIEKDGINRLTFNQLGSGYRSLIGMVGDMMIRLFKTQPEITKPSDLAGIVLIDELDLHWHPKWQRRLPTLLSEIFPKVQFIASTHSEMPLLGAPENSIFLKVTRTLEEGVKVHKIDIDLSNLLPNHLLTSALFDMDFSEITAVTNRSKNKNNLRTEDTMQEIKKTDDVEAYLKDYATNNAKFSDDLFD